MRSVEPGHPRPGNPGASPFRCCTAHRVGAANVAVCASTRCERHAGVGRLDYPDSAWRPPVAARCDSQGSIHGRNTAGRGRNASTAAPGHGSVHTGTGGPNGPWLPRASSQRVLDGLVPGCNTAAAPPLSARCRARRGTKLAGVSDRRRAHLLRHRRRCTASARACHGRCHSRRQRAGTGLASRPLQRDRLRLPGRPRAARQANLMRPRSASASQDPPRHRLTQNRVLTVG